MFRVTTVVPAVLLASLALAQAPGWEAKADDAAKPWDRKDSPGGVVGVAVDGKLVYAKGFGLANLEHSDPLSPESVMDVGSVAKQFTAMCVLLLEEEGKLKTSDDVRTYVPEVATAGQTVTLDHLLHMTSGLRDYFTIWGLEGWNGVDERTEADALATLAKQQGLNYAPGSRFLYSNSNYVVLGTVVRRVSGKPLAEFAKEHIFGHLGMDSTQFDVPGLVKPRRATSYGRGPGGAWVMLSSALDTSGDGGIVTTLGDLAKWHANLLVNKLGKGDAALVGKLVTPAVPEGSPTKYACGIVASELRGERRLGHNGNWLGFNAATLLFPGKKLSVFALGDDSAAVRRRRRWDLMVQ
ncbi:MAG: beta-lactamase family protein [Fimbriimonadaceae bacterium]|nr:beta-lactamase family protein [Fimbriimonadaceae bacterium]